MHRSVVSVLVFALLSSACGGGATGVAVSVGSVAGTVGVSVAAAGARPMPANIQTSPMLWKIPAGPPQSVPDQILVKLRAGVTTTQAAEIHRQLGAIELRRLDKIGVSLVRITSQQPASDILSQYRSNPLVEYAEPNYHRYLATASATPRPQATPTDPFYGFQWHYVNVNLPSAWDVTTGSSLVIVAVIDSGILSSHADLSGMTVQGFDFFDNDTNPEDPGCPGPSDLSHGSHVAGTVAAATNNGLGVAGVNWGGSGKTKIMPLRIFGNIGGICTTTSDRIINAIQYAADHSARVINMSLGGGAFSQAEQDAANYAFNTGLILIAAAGNSNTSCAAIFPAAYSNVVGVSATDLANNKAPYSNSGSCVDVAAPGGDATVDMNGDGFPDGVLSTSGTPASPTQYWFLQGTSMAAPHVAGLAALLISRGVTGPANIQSVIQSTATDLGAAGFDSTFGWGLINAGSALGAPGPTNPMKAFSGNISGTSITAASSIVTVASNGTYVVTNAQPGTRTIFAWQDSNGNGVIDGGDLYGSISGVVVTAGATTAGVNISVTEVPAGSPPITVSSAGSRSR